MSKQDFLPSTGIKQNCVITMVRVTDPKDAEKTKRTSVSMHVEHFKHLAEYIGGAEWLLRIIKYVAAQLERKPGDNLSQLVWAQIEANKEKWRKAIESGALR